jgi:1,4-dihydroxy-2-naphthoate octaprenyltransferase
METTEPNNSKPGFVKKWWVAIRPFALPASTMPVIFGTVLALTMSDDETVFNVPYFLGALFGMVFLHTGANLLNDVFDFKKGLDKVVNPVSGAVVRQWITPTEGLLGAIIFLLTGGLIGLWLVLSVGEALLWIGIPGLIIGVFYSLGPFALKDNALGDLAVFLDFGVLGSMGAWTVQTGTLSWVPALWAVPMSLLVIGILHANNWRDIKSDQQGGIRTMASLMGDQGSLSYYKFLLFGPFAVILLLLIFSFFHFINPPMPLTFLVTFVCLPLAVKLHKKGEDRHASKSPTDFMALDGATAQLNLAFGLLCTLALGLHSLVQRFVS